MKAWFTVPGPSGATRELRDVPVPVPGVGQVVVAGRAAGTNRGELIRGAALRPGAPAARPAPAGTEFAGEIAAVGDGVSGWKQGDRVMGRAVGSCAEYVAPGESVMVTAAPSGVGTVAIRIARHLGANPVLATTRSPAKAAALRGLDAHEVVDSRGAGWVDAVLSATATRGVDVVADHAGGPMLADNIRVLALKGRLVCSGRLADAYAYMLSDAQVGKIVSAMGDGGR